MIEVAAIRYRAFLSYSHSDMTWGKWLHSALEGYRIDHDLVGRETSAGRVPETLRPIFRDREDFTGGHALTDATIAALDVSFALIVLCSTNSATRPMVNEEVRLFRSRHPGRPVIPVVIDGTWPENFPSALRHELSTNGAITDRPITILGPDLRDSGDGKSLGLAKVVAGLTGLSADDVFRRAERARRRQARLRNGIIGVIAALLVVGSFFAWRSYQTGLELAEKQFSLDEIEALVTRYSPVDSNQAPGAKAGLVNAITAIANGAATDVRYAKALELLKAGRSAEAEPLLKAVAEEKAARVKNDARQAAEAYRNLGAIAGIADPARAREHYARAVELDPSNIAALSWSAHLAKDAGSLDAAETAFRRVILLKAGAPDDDPEVYWVHWARSGLGDIRVARGRLNEALYEYGQAADIAGRFLKGDSGNADWQRNLSNSYRKNGDVLLEQGNVPDALKAFRDSLAIAERLAKLDPHNEQGQRGLYPALLRITTIEDRQGNLAAALSTMQRAHAIVTKLIERAPKDVALRRDLSACDLRIGDLLMKQGNLSDAIKSLRSGLASIESLVTIDPDNAGWQRDISMFHQSMGEVLVKQGNRAEALKSIRDGLAIVERLTKADPRNLDWQYDLMVFYSKLGDVLTAQAKVEEAVASYRKGLDIMERLSSIDPANVQWRLNVIEFHRELALNRDDAERRFAIVAETLRKLREENALDSEKAAWLADAEERLTKMRGGSVK